LKTGGSKGSVSSNLTASANWPYYDQFLSLNSPLKHILSLWGVVL
jgi:hypothetical protein